MAQISSGILRVLIVFYNSTCSLLAHSHKIMEEWRKQVSLTSNYASVLLNHPLFAFSNGSNAFWWNFTHDSHWFIIIIDDSTFHESSNQKYFWEKCGKWREKKGNKIITSCHTANVGFSSVSLWPTHLYSHLLTKGMRSSMRPDAIEHWLFSDFFLSSLRNLRVTVHSTCRIYFFYRKNV